MGFSLESGMESVEGRLEGNPGPDFSRSPEWKTRTGFRPDSGMENPNRIPPRVRNGVGWLKGKPRPDSAQSPEWKTRTRFCPESGMESVGWRENPARISPGVRNGKPEPDFARNLEWSQPVGGKSQNGFI
ncbi:hypothetical protein HGM15179_016688 [Zosterops borbonicus]|uniref:Uncharacterized protein n=1 Tax=Zosterops borbonicus TaxID=364589 RepID=A0A8K1G286_9PASS|nr:hypothetical protein HGM15179_016688 [Zosterops borbonicus]